MRARWMLLAPFALAGALPLGCKGGAPSEPAAQGLQPLVAYDAWSGVEREADPFVIDAGAVPDCLGPGFYAEPDLGWVEIDTAECSWVTLRASAAAAVKGGSRLRVVVSHYDLDAPEPARAELKLAFGACEIWSKTVDIPGLAAVYEQELDSPCASERGGPVLFHLDNHGQNTWQLQELAVSQ
jgi:hypothetical protein